MTKLYQQFNINWEAITNNLLASQETDTDLGELIMIEEVRERHGITKDIPKAAEILKQQLSKRGYEVLVGNKTNSGLPTSIIVGTDDPMKKFPKHDFYELTKKLGIHLFSSGDFYMGTEPSN
ncbi:hypothetical protein ACFLZ7_01690 [Nanoarchaeota archaeon]